MTCKECGVTKRCVNDGDRVGTAKYVPCPRDTFFDSKYIFCDRDNTGVVVNECYFCSKSLCKNSAMCRNTQREMEGTRHGIAV